MRRRVRVLGILAALGLALTLLSACEQPLPKITVQTGAFSTTITPSTYCFDATQCRHSNGVDLPVVTSAGPDDTVLVDVPRAVADTGWVVQALTLDGTKALGGSGTLRDLHTYRVASNANGGQPFLVAVSQVRGSRSDGSRWSFLVRVSSD